MTNYLLVILSAAILLCPVFLVAILFYATKGESEDRQAYKFLARTVWIFGAMVAIAVIALLTEM